MTQFTPKLQADFTNELLRDFAKSLDEALKSQLASKFGHVPSVTLRNMSYRIMEANASDISAKYELYFQDSGRHVDMKRIQAGALLPIEVILDWVKRNRGYFKTIAGYQTSTANIPAYKQEERIAWAIAKKRSKGTIKRGKVRKRSNWLNPTFYSFFGRLVDDFINKQNNFLKQAIANDMQAAMGQNTR